MARRLLATAAAFVVSAGVLWWLLAGTRLDSLRDLLGHASILPLALALLLVPVIQALRAARFSLMLWGRGGAAAWPMFGVAVRLLVLNFLLPFKLGEAGFPLLMRRAFGTPVGQSIAVLLLARLLDLGAIATIVLACAALVLPDAGAGPLRVALLAGAAAVALVTAFLPRLPGLLRRASARPAQTFAGRLLAAADTTATGRPQALAVCASFGIWTTHALAGWLAASAVAHGIGPLAAALAAGCANLAFALPVPTIAGLGPPQAAWVMALDLAGIPWTAAVASAFACHLVLLSGAILLWLLTWLAGIWTPAGTPVTRSARVS